jgi:hypothetical protein
MAGEVRVAPDTFDHRCNIGSGQIRRGPWTCQICRRTWKPSSRGSWRTEGDGRGEIVAVVMRYDDDYTPPKRRRSFNEWWLVAALLLGMLYGLAIGVFLW